MLGRLRRPAEFEAVLATPVRARSAHFAAHHLPCSGNPPGPVSRQAVPDELSTGDSAACQQPVDDRRAPTANGWWFGVVVPKRHARKATTRNLLRRQMRSAFARHHAGLPHGLWLVRLRTAFDPGTHRSATSSGLRQAACAELDGLLKRAAA